MSDLYFYSTYISGVFVGLGVGALLWRADAILWRDNGGFMGRKNHR